MLPVPKQKPKKVLEFSRFKGIDLSNEPSSVSPQRSPNCLNMVSDLTGKPTKRKGYTTVLGDVGRVYGIFVLETLEGRKRVIHAEDKLYLWKDDNTTTLLYTGMNKKQSVAFPMSSVYQDKDTNYKSRLWILDGKKYLVYDGTSVVSVESIAYVPITSVSRNPEGGGENYDKVNLLSPYRINLFLGKASITAYQLDATNITAVQSVEKMDSNGNWISAGAYTVNTTTGVVTFSVAPGPPVVVGTDNVRIKFSRTVGGYADRINKCDVVSLFGVNNYDTVFVTGNADYPNSDFASYMGKPNYFPDVYYAQVGQSNTKILGYHNVTEYQAIIKEENGQDATVFLRNGEVRTNGDMAEAVYFIRQGVKGNGAVSKRGFLNIGSDNMFLSKDGVVALSRVATTGDRSTANRSEFVNRKLTAEPNLHTAVCIEHKGYGYFALNGKVYVVDGNQPKHYTNPQTNEYSYEWFLWDNIDVDCFCTEDEELYFGNANGINKFNTGYNSGEYTDNGTPICAYWETPITDLGDFSKYKTVANVYTELLPYSRSGIEIYIKVGNKWTLIDSEDIDITSFFDVNFNRFSFNTNGENVVIATKKVKEKGLILTQFKFENNNAENFGVISCKVEFKVKKEIK